MNPTAIENQLRLVFGDWLIIFAWAWFFRRLGKRAAQRLAVGERVAERCRTRRLEFTAAPHAC